MATKPASIQRLEIGSTRLTPESADPARAEHLRSVAANRRRRKSVGITIVALAAIGLLLYLFTYSPHSGPANTNIPTLRITRTDLLESAVATGTVKSMVGAEVKVGSQLSGIVASFPHGWRTKAQAFPQRTGKTRPADLILPAVAGDSDSRRDRTRRSDNSRRTAEFDPAREKPATRQSPIPIFQVRLDQRSASANRRRGAHRPSA